MKKETEKDAQKAAKSIVITFVVFAAIVALMAAWSFCYAYWHNFSPKKWADYPERRANMAENLLVSYELIGMSKNQIEELLGPDNNDFGYFNQADRSVYYLGSDRTIIDSEWLLIDFEDDHVSGYSMKVD